MAAIFDDILMKGMAAGQMPAKTSTAREWYRTKAKSVRGVNETKIMKDRTNSFVNTFTMGNMYQFYYDPKTKDDLPYYDRFPLIFPISPPKNGRFNGINLHYLHPRLRAKLMDAIYETTNNKKYDNTTKVKINYNILNNAAKFRYFKPTIKTYLLGHVRSRILYIHPSEWDIALFLPYNTFEKANRNEVWEDSANIIRGF